MDEATVPPLIRVTRGRASEEDVAALAAVLLLVRSRQQAAGATAAAGRRATVRWPAGLLGWNHHDSYHAPGAWTSQGVSR